MVALVSILIALSQIQAYALHDHRMASAYCMVCLVSLQLFLIRQLLTDGQLGQVEPGGCIHKKMVDPPTVTHPSTNWAWYRSTTTIDTNRRPVYHQCQTTDCSFHRSVVTHNPYQWSTLKPIKNHTQCTILYPTPFGVRKLQ